MILYTPGDFMKCIFLDFDGVINNWYHFDGVCTENALILKKIIELTGAKVVATTSNKYSFQRKEPVEYLKSAYYREYVSVLNELGIIIDDVTPYCKENRSLEIKSYLSEHEVESFVIVDDELISEDLQEHQVFLDLYKGLEEHHIEPIINILNNKLGFYPNDYDRTETSMELLIRINKYYNTK